MSTKKIIISALLLLILVGGVVAGVILVRRSQEIRERAGELEVPTEGAAISICMSIVDQNGTISDGSTAPGANFSISGFEPSTTSGGAAAGTLPSQNYTTPLNLNADVLNNDGNNDAECKTVTGLEIGAYYYTRAQNPGGEWSTPLYNDQKSVVVDSLDDFLDYDENLFDGNPDNDGDRNQNSDGHIVLLSDRQTRTLLVLHRYNGNLTDEGETIIVPEPTATPTPSPSSTPAPTSTPTPSPTPLALASSTPSPTPAPTSTATPTPSPTPTPSQSTTTTTTTTSTSTPSPTQAPSSTTTTTESLPDAGIASHSYAILFLASAFLIGSAFLLL